MAAPTSAHRRRIKHLASGAATLRLPALARSLLGTLLTNRGPVLRLGNGIHWPFGGRMRWS
jgi:hypothetical protein